MRIGAIDIGTNSTQLLIAEKQGTKLNRLVERMKVPRLGEDSNKTGYLKEAAIERTSQVVADYKEVIDQFAATPYAVATSAVREANNQQEFLNRVAKKADIDVNVISGYQEAYLSYLGVISELSNLAGQRLVVDIGGGSTELIQGQAEDLVTYDSINLGAVRLKEKFGEKIELLTAQVNRQIDLSATSFTQLVGVGGTITTLAAIKQEIRSYDRSKIQGVELTSREIKQIVDQLKDLSVAERKAVPGLGKNRIDIIIPGIIILLEIMNQTGLEKIIVSDAGLLEGIIFEKNV